MIEAIPTNLQYAHLSLIVQSEEGDSLMSYIDGCIEDLQARQLHCPLEFVDQFRGSIKTLLELQKQMRAATNLA